MHNNLHGWFDANIGVVNIENSLSLYFPNVVVEEFTIVPNEDENEVKINLTYSIQNTGINDAIEIQFT